MPNLVTRVLAAAPRNQKKKKKVYHGEAGFATLCRGRAI